MKSTYLIIDNFYWNKLFSQNEEEHQCDFSNASVVYYLDKQKYHYLLIVKIAKDYFATYVWLNIDSSKA